MPKFGTSENNIVHIFVHVSPLEQVDPSLRAMLDFWDVPEKRGYKICVCPLESQTSPSGRVVCPDKAGYTDTNALDVQADISGLEGNGFSGSFVYIPLLGCQGGCPPSVAPAASYIRRVTGSIHQISLIPVAESCTVPNDNPISAPDGSGVSRCGTRFIRDCAGVVYLNPSPRLHSRPQKQQIHLTRTRLF